MAQLMFSKSDVEAVVNPLIRLLRLIFYRKGITLDDFAARCAEHGQRLGMTSNDLNIHRNNLRKPLKKTDEMTWRFFYYMMLNILCLKIVDVRLIFRDADGNLVEIGSSDPVDLDQPKSPVIMEETE